MAQIHILDGQENTILDFITTDNIIDDNHKKSLEDTLETYDFIAFGDRRYSEFLEKRNRVIIPDEDGTLREFIIFENARYLDTEGRKIQVFAHASYLELKKASIVYPSNFKGTASQHGGRALNGTGWSIGLVEVDGDITININEHTVPYDYLKRIAKEFDGELSFRIEHDGSKVTGRYVDILERVGTWQGREVEFGKDLDSIRRVEKQDIVTALLGLGPEREDGTRIELLVEDNDALQRWGRIDEHGELQHLIEPYEIQSERSEMTETQARQYTRTALNKRINTQITYETTILDLEEVAGHENKKIRFGDTIKIKDEKFNPPLYLEARVFEMTRSIKRKDKKDIKLGDFIEHTEEDVNAIWNQLKKDIQNRVSFYEMAEYTYDKLTIDDKDEIVFEDGKSFAEATGITAEENAKAFAVEEDAKIKLDVQEYADNVSEQKAQSALEQAKMYAVAETVYNQQMQQIANDISERAPIEYVDGELRHAIDNLEIGGTNLVGNFNLKNWAQSNQTIVPSSVGLSYVLKLEQNKDYVLHRSNINNNNRFRLFFYDIDTDDEDELLGIDRHEGVTYDTDTEIKFNSGDYKWLIIYLTNQREVDDIDKAKIKLEKSNKATDWSPAPEDMFSEIEKKADGNTVYTIEQIDNKINNLVSVTQYTADKEGIITDINTHGTRIGQNEKAIGLKADSSELNAVENSLTTKIGNVEVTAEGAKMSANEVRADLDGLEIGGRNLATSPENGEFVRNNLGVGNYGAVVNEREFVVFNNANGASLLFDFSEVEVGQTYTINADMSDTMSSLVGVAVYDKDKNLLELSDLLGGDLSWTSTYKSYVKYSGTLLEPPFRFTVVDERVKYVRLRLGIYNASYVTRDVTIKYPKLEKGNKATDWSPAPEDTDEAINQVSGRVETLDASVTTLAGEVSLKASQSIVDSLEGRVSTAEGELSVLPGEINAKVSRDGVVGAINATPERLLIDFDKVKITNELEAKHIKSLAGLNVNDQFIVDSRGNVSFKGNLTGASGTFSGDLQGSTIRGGLIVLNKALGEDDNVGLTGTYNHVDDRYNREAMRYDGVINLNSAYLTFRSKTTVAEGTPYQEHMYQIADYGANSMDIRRFRTSSNNAATGSFRGNQAGVRIDSDRITFYLGGSSATNTTWTPKTILETLGVSTPVLMAHDEFWLPSDGRIRNGNAILRLTESFIASTRFYENTSTATSNLLRVSSSGQVWRSTSSRRYKLIEKQMPLERAKKFRNICAKTWYDKKFVETYADALNYQDKTELQENYGKEKVSRIPGLIAEDLHDEGLYEFVEYDDEGRPDGISSYSWVPLLELVKDLYNRVEELENERSII